MDLWKRRGYFMQHVGKGARRRLPRELKLLKFEFASFMVTLVRPWRLYLRHFERAQAARQRTRASPRIFVRFV